MFNLTESENVALMVLLMGC